MYNNEQSKYCYPGSDVLINMADFREQACLDDFEHTVSIARMAELVDKPLIGIFNLQYLCAIHRYIFGDIYPFAGKLRDEDIAKGSFRFAKHEVIHHEADLLFRELRMENYLLGLEYENVVQRLEHYMAEINVLQPFREGNGRVQREFIRTLALYNGFMIDWERVDSKRILQASIHSVYALGELQKVLADCIVNQKPKPDLKKLFQTKKNKNDFER